MKENDIRPKELFEEYLRLSKNDADRFDINLFVKVNCVACGSEQLYNKIHKYKFNYQKCSNCGSLFCNPRPSQEILKNFYENSISAKYWFEKFLPQVEKVRRDKIFSKKAKMIKDIIVKRSIPVNTLCDCGAGSGILIEELSKILKSPKFYAIEPGNSASKILLKKGIDVLSKTVEESSIWNNKFDFVISLEVFEHVFNPEKFISSLYNLTKKEGYCLITTLGYEGFDILTLGEKSKSISPPHHLNFLSIKGFEKLFYKVGFSDVVITTPGVLDVDIVKNSENAPDFFKVLVKRGVQALNEFQDFLIKYNLSSHVWVLAKK